MADSVKVVGLEDLGRTVELFKQKLQRTMVRKAANAGVEVFRREIRARAPVRQDEGLKGKEQRKPGYLKKHIGRWVKVKGQESYSVMVGPMASAFYARFYELGTSHQPARPFMRPAFDQKAPEAEKVFAATLKQQIEAELK